MPSPKSKPKKRNPQDSTLRNVRSMQARMQALEDTLVDLGQRVQALEMPASEPPDHEPADDGEGKTD